MSIDLSQFHQVFFEESHEGINMMESALLTLDVAHLDPETINAVFRAAHSIKGGSGTFGFTAIAEFTHVLETLLDLIRSDQFVMQADHVDLLLQSVDCLRSMIRQLEAGEAPELTVANALKAQFEAALAGESAPAAPKTEVAESVTTDVATSAGWQIYFKAHADILRTGNEPLRMFRELATLGELNVEAIVDDVPAFGSLDPETCYLAWNLTLLSACEEEQVREVFEWVAEDSELRLDPLQIAPLQTAALEASIDTQPETQPETEAAPVVEAIGQQAPVAAAAVVSGKRAEAKTEAASIRVGTDKVDSLINMVGELVITQSMLSELGREFSLEKLPKLLEGLEQLSQHTRELQENVMRIRMLPISFAFSRFPRLVHDMGKSLGKKVELILLGEQTELDKTVMERIGDPLVHLVRNSLDHGIEAPDKRRSAGKPETGTITLNAFHQGGNIVIQIMDDGGGLNRERIRAKAVEQGLVAAADNLSDEQVYDMIFRPGFSTASEVTDISGRGVGMDVVRRNIQELNGSVEVTSVPGKGCTFTIRLPLTLAILDGQLFRVGKHVYILPLVSIVESIQSQGQVIHHVTQGCDVLKLRDEYVPIVRLWNIFNIDADAQKIEDGLLVVVEGDNIKIAILVDDLLAQQQVVIKSLQDNYRSVDGVSGATILGDGTVSLILDISGLIKLAGITRDDYRRVDDRDNPVAA